jgi:hypothetical protein
MSRATFRSIETLAKRYRSLHLVRFPVGDNLELVYSKASNSRRILPSYQVAFLSHCREFRTLDEHARNIYQERLGNRSQAGAMVLEPSVPIRIESVKKQLLQLAEDGLLVSDFDVLERCKYSTDSNEEAPQIASVGVVTRDRPESLVRCLESYIDNCERHGRAIDFVVMDDSESVEARVETRQMLRDLSERHEVEISYAGLEEKLQYAEALIAESGAPPEVVKFALFGLEGCGRSTGANRNALLLHTAGDSVLSVDDDTVCQVGTVYGTKYGLALDSRRDGFIKFRFFPNHASALQSVVVNNEDVLANHEQLLGKTIGACISKYSEPSEIDLDNISHKLLEEMHRRGRIGVTISGVIGDSGIYSPAGCLALEAESRERMVASEADYHSVWNSREMIRTVNRLTISDSAWCMAMALGLDNRSLLPPFMPVYRNSDGLFGLTLRACFDDVYFGHLPSTILHAPMETRSYNTDEILNSATKFRFCDLAAACIGSADFRIRMSDERERILALGKHLMELGNLALSDFEELARLQIWRFKSNYIMTLENLLKLHREKPEFWAKDVKRFVGILRETLIKDLYLVPQDVAEGREPIEIRHQAQRLIYKFGELIYWWREIINGAKRLRERNCRLAISV